MKKIILSLLFACMALVSYSQIGLVENFDAGLTLPTGWTSDAEDYAVAFVQNCDGRSVRVNLDDTNTDAQLTSPNFVGQSNATDLTIAFDYKVVDWSEGIDGTVPGWGEILIQYSTNDGAAWATIETINDVNHVTSDVCSNWSVVIPAASLPTGSDFKLRFDANWTAESYYIYLDNISATQVVSGPPSCVSLMSPTNGSTGVSINSDLEWSTATNIPTGYTVVVGTTSGGTDIADNVNAGLSTTYDLPTLEYATIYYVSIVPFNANGDAIDCPEFTFTTGADPNAPVDCAAGTPINTVYCYGNNETQTWNFQSSDGSPLNIFFNAGEMEGGNWDQVTIYDGSDNTGTVLYDDSNGGNMTGISQIANSGFMFVEIDSDGSGSCQANNYIPLDFDVSCVDTTALPNCNASLITPVNGAVGVGENTGLVWSAASILVDGYNLTIGTTPGGTDILDGLDVGNVLNYDPGTLAYETTYYVSIIPYNANGSATNCNEESFTTRNDPNQIVDCSINEIINTTYCYENGSNTFVEIFNFQSATGAPLNLFFNSGYIESCCDFIRILDADGSILYEGNNGGDLSGLSIITTGDSLTILVDADTSVSCESTGNAPWDFDVSCVDTTALPNCNASLNSPLNGAIDVNENEDINWSPATIFVTGYTLFVGTTPGGTDIVNAVDVGNVTTYALDTLPFDATIYVTIIPYNDNGDATDCTEESFQVRSDPNQILDCSANESVNTEYCYTNNDTMQFNFASNDGSPLAVFFNSGETENNWDELVITDSDGTIIYNDYGNGGDLAGLSFFSTGDSITVGVTSDGVIVNCTDNPWNFDVFCFDATAPPNCNSVLTTPTDGAIDVDINTGITWSEASIVVTGYSISIGSTPGGTDIADNVDVGDVLTYNPGTLTNASFYYVTVVPYNDNGPATDCTEQSFKTVCLPQVVTFNAIGDCDTDPNNPEFILEVNIADLSGSASILITDDQGSPAQTAFTTGVITMGPYAANTVVTITTIKSDDDTCDVISSPITFICPPPPNLCSIVYAGEDASVNCDDTTSTDLTAVYHLFGQDTNNYVINGLETCPLPSTVGGTPTSLNIDDIWSEVLSIGFEFCFFGEVYNQILVGSNGVLSFELENAGNYNGWPFTETLPNNTNPTLSQGNIFGVAHDIDPSVCGDINYLVIGSAPYRMFVVNYTNVCHFSCNELLSSSQIILYESSNNIDVNVFDKPTCTTWNSGNAVIGVQNIAGDMAFTPPARNTGPWSATDESWRFAPYEDVPSFVFEWFDGTTSIGDTETITVSPTETTTYTASVTYDLCTGGTATVTDDVIVTVSGSGGDASFTMTPTCDGGTSMITGDEGGTFALNPEPGDGTVIDETTGTVTGGSSGATYTVEYTILGDCGSTSTQDVTVLPAEDASFTMTATCDGGTAMITGNEGGTFAINPELGDGAVIDPATGTVIGGSSSVTYTIEYTTSDSECAAISTQDVTVLPAEDASFNMTATCDGGTTMVTGDEGGIFAFNPEPGDGTVIDPVTGTVTSGVSGVTYTVEYTTSDSECAATSTQDVTVLPAEDASFEMITSCDSASATITGDAGGTFAFNPVPTDDAVIDSVTGTISNATLGNTYTIEYTTSGSCPASSTQSILLEDSIPPVAIGQNITIQLDDSGNVTITADDINNGSSDDCGIQDISIDMDSFTCDDVGENTVTLNVTDNAGNTSTTTSIVTVEDNISPEAICNNITVELDGTGNYVLSSDDIEAIGVESTDACGIESMNVSMDSFTCDEIGENTIILTIVDVNGNETTCEAIITVDGVIPSVEIIETSLSEFCEEIALTAVGEDIVTYEWTTGGDTDTITVTENGTYGVTVTSVTGCTTYQEYIVTSIGEGAPISDYTIVAKNDVFLHGNNVVQSGGVGVTSSNGEIKLHQSSHIETFGQADNFTLNQGSTIAQEINEPASPTMPEFIYNTLSTSNSQSVTIARGDTQTLDGDVYDDVWVRQGATVIFTQQNVFINRIKTSEQATIEFEDCANVYVNDKFILAKYGTINANQNPVVFYVDNDVHIEKGSNVHGIIYANSRQILAKGSNVNSNNPDPTYMTGLFIADKVHGINEIIWNSADICNTCPLSQEDDGNRVANFDVLAWPNPSNTEFNMRLQTINFTSDAIVNVFDMSGKLVHSGEFRAAQQYAFGSELEGGVYIVKIEQAKNVKVIRLIKY